jgi:hypothetical protein
VARGAGSENTSAADIEARLRLLADLRPLLTVRHTKDLDPQAFALGREQFEAMKRDVA